jgi:hypothetical protein
MNYHEPDWTEAHKLHVELPCDHGECPTNRCLYENSAINNRAVRRAESGYAGT